MGHNLHSRFSRPASAEGSVTLVSLCLMTTLGIALASYLALSSRSAQLSNRLLHREKAQQLAQVGLEEALWALNHNNWAGSGADGSTSWSISGLNRATTLTYGISGAGSTGLINLTVANFASSGPTWPTITSHATVTLQSGETFKKSVQATTAPAPLFSNAIASADSYVSFVAAGTVDSWNSDPDDNPATPAVAYSFTAGNPVNYSAVVAGRGNGTTGVILTQATVRGYVATFGLPVSYSTSGSPPASVVGPATPAGTAIDSARLGKSAFVPISDVFEITLPATNGANFGGLINNALALVSALLSAPGADVYKTSGNLSILGIPLLSPSITIDRPIKLIVDGDLSISGAGQITVTATGSLELFVAGDVSIGGSGLLNQTREPRKLALFSYSSSTSDALEYTSASNFCGVIFCAHKPIDIRQNATFEGALLSRQFVRFSTNATSPVFHYDAALRSARFSGVPAPYVIKQVTDL